MGDSPAFWAVIPATVRYDQSLSDKAKLIFCDISALQTAHGYCWATNDFFAQAYGITDRTVRNSIKALVDAGYVKKEVIRDEKTHQVIKRKLWIAADPSVVKFPDPSGKNFPDPPEENFRTLISMNNINTEHIPPLPPTGGVCDIRTSRHREPRKETAYLPDRFEGFWKYYPEFRRRDKQKCMDEWDKLKPDAHLVAQIARGLDKLKASDDWQRGIGIPYPHKFLRDRRWLDAQEISEASAESPEGWAADEEVL